MHRSDGRAPIRVVVELLLPPGDPSVGSSPNTRHADTAACFAREDTRFASGHVTRRGRHLDRLDRHYTPARRGRRRFAPGGARGRIREPRPRRAFDYGARIVERHRAPNSRGSAEGFARRCDRAGEVGGHYRPCPQRVDLLDHVGATRGNSEGPRAACRFGTQGRDAPPVLLDRMHAPHGQADQPFAEIYAWQTIQKDVLTGARMDSAGRRLVYQTHINEVLAEHTRKDVA